MCLWLRVAYMHCANLQLPIHLCIVRLVNLWEEETNLQGVQEDTLEEDIYQKRTAHHDMEFRVHQQWLIE